MNFENKKTWLQQKVNELTADIIKLRAELNYLEKQKGLAMQEKIMGEGRNRCGKGRVSTQAK